MLKPSKYQQKVFEVYQNTAANMLVAAVAGSGKTTTLVELMKRTPENLDLFFVAFNKHIVEELKKRVTVTPKLSIGTLHSKGYASFFHNHRGKIKLDEWKLHKICKKTASTWKDVEKNKIDTKLYNIKEFYDIYRLTYQQDLTNFMEIIDKYNLNVTVDDIPKIKQVIYEMENYDENHNSHGEFMIDFVDMIYIPIKYNFDIKRADVLLIDEAQDLSAIQHEFLKRMLKPNGRIVAVGDKYQSIYGFGGADLESWDRFKEFGNIIELPLSYCYRCGTKIVEKANAVHNIMESPETQFEGEVIENGNLLSLKPEDFVLCRNTKPLVELYFQLLEKNIPAYIKGRDIGTGLIKVIKPFQYETSDKLLAGMEVELNKIFLFLKSHGVHQPQKNQKYIAYQEKIEIIKCFSWKYKTTQEIIETLEFIFKDDGKGVILSTIHKSKGLEADTVYFYLPHLIPSKYASKTWEMEQEMNLLYVAITRAKKKLIFVREKH